MVPGKPASKDDDQGKNEHHQRPFPVDEIIIAFAVIIPDQLCRPGHSRDSETDGKGDCIFVPPQRKEDDTGNQQNELQNHDDSDNGGGHEIIKFHQPVAREGVHDQTRYAEHGIGDLKFAKAPDDAELAAAEYFLKQKG
ncbi:hypothetical protein D3C75_967040 [compost metagenome]